MSTASRDRYTVERGIQRRDGSRALARVPAEETIEAEVMVQRKRRQKNPYLELAKNSHEIAEAIQDVAGLASHVLDFMEKWCQPTGDKDE